MLAPANAAKSPVRVFSCPTWASPSFESVYNPATKLGDAQVGHEKTLTGLLAALAGANLIYGAGMIESGVTFDFGQLVMDNEFAKMIKHALAGIPVDDETLAVEDIARGGPFGDFLSLDATLRHMRELSQPEVLDRRVREDWEARGSRDLYSTCREKARD